MPNHYPEQKNFNKWFTVLGWKFQFSAQDRVIWNIYVGDVKILQYLLTLKPPLKLTDLKIFLYRSDKIY